MPRQNKTVTKTFKVEIEVDASYDIEYYEYGADADGRRGEERFEIENVVIETPVGDLLMALRQAVEDQAEDVETEA